MKKELRILCSSLYLGGLKCLFLLSEDLHAQQMIHGICLLPTRRFHLSWGDTRAVGKCPGWDLQGAN